MKNIQKSILISFISSTIIVMIQNPSINNLLNFFIMPFSSTYFIGYFLDKFSLLLFACVGCFISLTTNNVNLGGQGQIYLGGFFTALILSSVPEIKFLSPLFIVITFIFVFSIGGLICFISSYLKSKKNINELLTTFIISSFIIYILDFLISNPLQNKSTNLLAMKEIQNIFQINHFKNFATLNITIFISIFLAIGCLIFFSKTQLGHKFLLSGKAPEFSKFRGYNVNLYNYLSMFVSGGLNSTCGFFAVIATYYTCFQGFYLGIGWNALTTALICSLNPKLLIPSCLLLSYFFTATDCAMITNSISSGTSEIIQGILFLSSAIPYLHKENTK